jgi:folate-binding protein YgfZ
MSAILVQDGIDEGAIWHLGNPAKEGKLLDEGVGWAVLPQYSVITISGADRANWLQNITTQEIEKLPVNHHSGAMILDAQGHIVHQLYFYDDGNQIWIHTQNSKCDELIAFLEKMKFMLRVEVIDRRTTHTVLRAPGIVDEFGGPYLIVENEKVTATTQAWGSENQVGMWALEAQRIQHGRARILLDTDYKSIPNELRLLNNFVHMKKGCYPGQETVAKVFNLGQPPRLLSFIHLDGSEHELPHYGDEITSGGIVVGTIGSVARHHELGPIALALIKRSIASANPPVHLDINGVAGTIEPWRH